PSGSGPNNYTSFSDAVNDLINQGVNGPVLFQVSAGIYNGPIEIPFISGTNSVNTVTFDGGHGNAVSRVIEHGASGQWDEDVLRLVNSQWMRFKNLTFRTTAKSFGVAVHLLNDCSNTEFVNCTIEAPVSTNWYHRAFVANSTTASNNGTCDWGSFQTNILIDSSTIIGGYYGILALTGGGDFFVSNSSLLDCYSYGIAVGYNNYFIRNNYIRMDENSTGNEAIRYCNGSPTFEVSGNVIENAGYAGFISYSGSTQGRGKIFNNYIRMNINTGQSLGIALQTTAENNIDIWNNTITIEASDNPTSAGIYVASGLIGEDIQNNNILILSPKSQAQAVNSSSGSVTTMDYNNYYRVNKLPSVLLTVNGISYLESDYKTSTGYNQNSSIDNPQISSLSMPVPGNICLLGTPLSGINTDITGAGRGNPPTIGAYERRAGVNLDAELAAFTKPVFPVASGNNDVEVVVKNKGLQAITSLDIHVELGSVTKTINWTGTLNPCSEMTILFTGSNQLSIGPGANQLRAWVANPNGSADLNTSNDELSVNICLPFSAGTYTIDPSGSGPANFTSFSEAAEALNCGGVAGAVVFNIAATTFNNDEFKLVFVKGASATNTITLNGAGADSTVVTHPNTPSSAVISLTGTPYVTIQNMTISAIPDYERALIQLASGSDYVTIRNNSLEYTSYNTAACFGIIYGAVSTNPSGNEANYTLIEDNTFSNTGYAAIWATSSGYTSKNTGLVIRNNTISNNWNAGIRISYTDNMIIEKNRITMSGHQWNYALMVEATNNNKIRDNYIRNGGYAGIYFYSSNSDLINNIVTDPANNQWGSGIQVVAANNSKIYHNTVFFNHQSFTFDSRAVLNVQNTIGVDVRNNIFIYKGQTANGAVIYKDPWSNFSNLDHNIYHADIGNVYTEDFGTYYKTLDDFKS
ncbi:MAG TPA: right-handed parallel beta-helix repeat-containing protein, partial [Bacteroidia bacterium]|nr:right-handed parallel beta-helix repeat-containing protein [Bacteroidia bacterium]